MSKEVLGEWLDFRNPEVFLVPRTDLERLRLLEQYGFGGAKIQILDEGQSVNLVPHFDCLGGLLAACRNYLMIPTFTDGFLSHIQRREWTRLIGDSLGKEYRQAVDKNRLRHNHFYAIYINLKALRFGDEEGNVCLPRNVRTKVSRFERGIREHTCAMSCYADLGVGYKVMLSQTTAEACRNLLTELNLG